MVIRRTVVLCLFLASAAMALHPARFSSLLMKMSTQHSAGTGTSHNEDACSLHVVHDLWIVGGGVLGGQVVTEWVKLHNDDSVVVETRTDSKHDTLASHNVIPRLRSSRDTRTEKAKNVLICIPPSVNNDYIDEVEKASEIWLGPEGGGNLVFTSSISVYGDATGATVTEDYPVDITNTRSALMVAAEERILAKGGCVLRLSGLYNAYRGPHTYWLRTASEGKSVPAFGEGLLNMLHYDDAAAAAIKTLESRGLERRVFVAVDDQPVSKVAICRAAIRSGLFPNAVTPQFTGSVESPSKIVDSSATRAVLGWRPRHRSFEQYMRQES